MIGIVLAGGYAKRLWPLTQKIAKPLLPVAGLPILNYVVNKLIQLDDVDEIVISINKRFESQFKNWLKKYRFKNVWLRVEDSLREEEKPGAIKAISETLKDVDSKEYLIIAGDNFFTSDLKDFIRYYRKKKSSTIALYDVKNVKLAKEYAVVKLNRKGRIISFIEKPKKPESTLIGTCIYLLPDKSLKKIYKYLDEGLSPDSPGHFIGWLTSKEKVYGYRLEGYWVDIGNLASYAEANRFVNRMKIGMENNLVKVSSAPIQL